MSDSVPVSEAKHIAKRYRKRCVIISVMDELGAVETITYGVSNNHEKLSKVLSDHANKTTPQPA